jgi:hypothetical protein
MAERVGMVGFVIGAAGSQEQAFRVVVGGGWGLGLEKVWRGGMGYGYRGWPKRWRVPSR